MTNHPHTLPHRSTESLSNNSLVASSSHLNPHSKNDLFKVGLIHIMFNDIWIEQMDNHNTYNQIKLCKQF